MTKSWVEFQSVFYSCLGGTSSQSGWSLMISWYFRGFFFTLQQQRPQDLGPCSLFLCADTYDDPSPSHKNILICSSRSIFQGTVLNFSKILCGNSELTQIIEPFSQKLEFRDIETCKPGVFRISTLMLKQIPTLIDDQNRFVKTAAGMYFWVVL